MDDQFFCRLFIHRFNGHLDFFEYKVKGITIHILGNQNISNYLRENDFDEKCITEYKAKNQNQNNKHKIIKSVYYNHVYIFINKCFLSFSCTFNDDSNSPNYELEIESNWIDNLIEFKDIIITEAFPKSLIFFQKIYNTYSILKRLEPEFILTYDLFDSLEELGSSFSKFHIRIEKKEGIHSKIELILKIMKDIQNKYDHYLSPEGFKGSAVIKGLVDNQKQKENLENSESEDSSDSKEETSSEFLKNAEDFLSKRGF